MTIKMVASHFNYLDLKNTVMTLTALLALCDANASPGESLDRKVMLHLILIFIDLRNAIVPLTTPLASFTLMPTPMASYDQSNVAPHLSCFNLRNLMVPSMMLLAGCSTIVREMVMLLTACGTVVRASGIKGPKIYLSPHFNCLGLRKKMVLLTMLFSFPNCLYAF